ncbi:MAG: DCC1-like thiol-disulfide oxidoreductase family protein [Proteobacteria bacterium]|nr:DCC1-like thiol-disulfide oxidoreductase family protein [Pseudomonadota bacterium]
MTTADNPAETVSSDDEWGLVYDWQCPACNLYCHQLCARETGGRFRLINARDNPEVMKEITARGFDIDQGMILKINNQFYYGAEAIHTLALISSPSTVFNRLNIWIFRSRRRSELLYPVLRACRNFLLKLLRRTKINNLGLPDNERF